MAHPFGQAPRFNDYLEWARLNQGCTYKSGIMKVDGTTETFILIENPANGKHTFEFMTVEERLTPSVVAGLDRRLGLDSPFPKLKVVE